METSEALTVVRTLADGIDPVTGAVFPDDSPYQRARTVRALLTVVEALDAPRRRRAHLPPQTGRTWTPEQDDRLRAGHAAGLAVRDLAAELGRTTTGVRVRLVRFGMDPDQPGHPRASEP